MAISPVPELDTSRSFVISGCRIKGLCCLWWIVGLAADEVAEEGGGDGLGDDDLIIDGATLEMEEFHACGLGREDMG